MKIALVGGAVRDELLGREIHDRDYEETTELVKYNIDNKFLSYQECLDRGIQFIETDKQKI